MEDMKPFFDDRERKYLAYTSEKNEIDSREKPKQKSLRLTIRFMLECIQLSLIKQLTISLEYQSNGIMMFRTEKDTHSTNERQITG